MPTSPPVYPPVRATAHIALRPVERPAPRRQAWQWMLTVVLVGIGVSAGGYGLASIPLIYLAFATPELLRVDLREHRLPNRLVLPGIVIGLLVGTAEWAVRGVPPLVSLLGGAAYAGFLLILNLVGGMGMGDVKLGLALGFASWSAPVVVLSPVLAFFAGGIVSVVLLARRGRGSRIAFGPYLLGGFWAAVLLAACFRPAG